MNNTVHQPAQGWAMARVAKSIRVILVHQFTHKKFVKNSDLAANNAWVAWEQSPGARGLYLINRGLSPNDQTRNWVSSTSAYPLLKPPGGNSG